jgi:uncharacterized protein
LSKITDNALLEPVNNDRQAEKTVDAERHQRAERAVAACFHCGERCPDDSYAKADKIFCCNGCLTVHDILTESGLGHFYDLSEKPGVRVRPDAKRGQWAYLDEPSLQQRLLDFTDGRQSRVTFHIPAIHCIACVWLLENLFRLNPGIGRSQVNYPKREVAIAFAPEKIKLSELVALLAAIGYEPTLTLGELEKRAANPARKRQWLQVGIAGMCGPLALALPNTGRRPAGFFAGRIAYNLGRIITYCALGLVFGLIGRTLLLAGVQRWVSIALGVALLIGLFTSRRLALWRPVTAIVDRVKSAMGALLRRRSADALLVLGLLNGLLPCGLVYVACAGATATGDLFSGALYMLTFGLGTVPMMLAISLSGKLVPFPLRLKLLKAVPVAVFVLAALLILRGMSLGISYVSPDLSSGGAACCHE